MKEQKNKKSGFIVSVELMLIVTIMVIGLIVGMVPVRDAVVAELSDVATAVNSIDNSFTFDGISVTETSGTGAIATITAQVAGSAYEDIADVTLVTAFVAPGTTLDGLANIDSLITDPDAL